MNKKLIRLTESDLHRIVKESAQKILNEIGDTPRGQFALGAVAARAGHRMFNSKSDRERDYWNNVENHAAEIGHNNVNPAWDDETEYFDNGIDYWQDNMRQYESKNANNDLIRLTESDLHKIVKESVNKILKEVKYNGHSLHGDNPYDWATMHHVRDMKADKADDLPTAVKHLNNSERNLKNAIDTDKNNSLPTAMSRGKNRAKAIVGEDYLGNPV